MNAGVEHFLAKLDVALARAGRKADSLRWLPVSKGQTIERIRAVLGDARVPQRLGENYFDELVEKRAALTEISEWHYLGRLQSRKIAGICEAAGWVHGLYRLKELEAVARSGRGTRWFLEVNVSDEEAKGGCAPTEIPVLLEAATRLGVETQFQGLMTMAAPLEDVGDKTVRSQFAKLRECRERHCPRASLNMGMSSDFDLAITEGADWIRVGTSLFGARS